MSVFEIYLITHRFNTELIDNALITVFEIYLITD